MSRTFEQIENSARHNETKLKILICIHNTKTFLSSVRIARQCGLTNNNASQQMKKLTGQGYVWRRKIKGVYFYRYLKNMGVRVLEELWIRDQLHTDMNLKHPIPQKLRLAYDALKARKKQLNCNS